MAVTYGQDMEILLGTFNLQLQLGAWLSQLWPGFHGAAKTQSQSSLHDVLGALFLQK